MSEQLTVQNVEESINKAIARYWEMGMVIDGMFWGMAVKLLKEKYGIKEVKDGTSK